MGLSIRLIKEHKVGFSYTTSLDDRAIERAIESAAETAGFMPEDEYANLHSFGSSVYPAVDTLDNKGLIIPCHGSKIPLAIT